MYVPAVKRKYGYHVLLLLYGEKFVAGFEPVRDKKNNALVIRNWWREQNVKISLIMQKSIRSCMQSFMLYLGVDSLRIDAACTGDPPIALIL